MKVWYWGDEQKEELVGIEEVKINKMDREMREYYFVREKPSIILQDEEGHSIYECKGIFTPKNKLSKIIERHKEGKKGFKLLWK